MKGDGEQQVGPRWVPDHDEVWPGVWWPDTRHHDTRLVAPDTWWCQDTRQLRTERLEAPSFSGGVPRLTGADTGCGTRQPLAVAGPSMVSHY